MTGSSTSRLTIRPLAAADRAAWDALWAGYLAFYRTELSPEVSALTFTRLLDDREPMHGLVAEVDGKVVGIAHYLMHRSTWAREQYCYLEDLFVSPAARGHGAASALIEAIADRARALNADRMYWTTHESNSTARRLYDKLAMRTGFVHYRKAL